MNAPDIKLRPFHRPDFDTVLRIERACFPEPWGKPQFAAALQTDGARMNIAHRCGIVVGYIVMAVRNRRIQIWNLAVEPESQRGGIGRALVESAKRWLAVDCREHIEVEVRDRDVRGQLFFKALGFVATGIDKEPFLADPAIHFEFALGTDVLREFLGEDP